jgi:hypothetical protein
VSYFRSSVRTRRRGKKRERNPDVKKERNGRRKGEREGRRERVCEDSAKSPAMQPVVTWSWQTGPCLSCRQHRFHRQHPYEFTIASRFVPIFEVSWDAKQGQDKPSREDCEGHAILFWLVGHTRGRYLQLRRRRRHHSRGSTSLNFPASLDGDCWHSGLV